MTTQDNPPVEVTQEDAALAKRFWSVHPRELQDMGVTREQWYAQEIARHRLASQRPAPATGDVGELLLRAADLQDGNTWPSTITLITDMAAKLTELQAEVERLKMTAPARSAPPNAS